MDLPASSVAAVKNLADSAGCINLANFQVGNHHVMDLVGPCRGHLHSAISSRVSQLDFIQLSVPWLLKTLYTLLRGSISNG